MIGEKRVLDAIRKYPGMNGLELRKHVGPKALHTPSGDSVLLRLEAEGRIVFRRGRPASGEPRDLGWHLASE